MRRPGRNTNKPTKRTSPRPAMKHSATLSEAHALAPWSLPEPTLTYFPNARFVLSDRDLGAGAVPQATRRSQARRSRAQRVARRDTRQRGAVMPDATGDFGHVPVLLDRCIELLTPALARQRPAGSGAVLVDATIGA